MNAVIDMGDVDWPCMKNSTAYVTILVAENDEIR